MVGSFYIRLPPGTREALPFAVAGARSIQRTKTSKPRAVSVSSISSILDPAELSRLRLVKIDVEGYELEVLHGLAEVFDAGYRPALVVEVHGDAAPAVGAWAAESRRTHGLFTYRLVAGRSSDRSVPDTAPVEPIHDTELRSLESKFFELLLSPLPLIDDGASAARSAVLRAWLTEHLDIPSP